MRVIPAFLGLISTALCATSRTIVDGFIWAENLVFAPPGVAFVSELTAGVISKVSFDTTTSSFNKEVHLSGFSSCLGLATNKDGSRVFAAVKDASSQYAIIEFTPFTPKDFKIISILPKCPNGLTYHMSTGLLYATSEGSFLPRAGEIFEVNPDTGAWSSYYSGLYATDGAWINQESHLLYVSQVLNTQIHVIDLSSGLLQDVFTPGNVNMIDDLMVMDGYVLGADFWSNSLVSFPAVVGENGDDAVVLMSDLSYPTSVRSGNFIVEEVAGGFSENCLYVTEGGLYSLVTKNTRQRLVEVCP